MGLTKFCPTTSAKFKILLKLVGSLSFLLHVGFIGFNQLNPSETFTKYQETPLDQIDFPIIFKICLKPSLNLTLLHSLGYKNIKMYFLGRSKHNASIYGWGGHGLDGRPLYQDVGGKTCIKDIDSNKLFLLQN